MSPVRILIYDATQLGPDDLWLSNLWEAGAFAGRFDFVLGATSWEDVYRWAERLPLRTIAEVEYWMHGSPGAPRIAGQAPDLQRLAWSFGVRLSDSMHWFRCCAVGQGERGQRWAEAATILGTVVVHTRIVSQAEPSPVGAGPLRKLRSFLADAWSILTGVWFQSGCYALRPGERAHWDPEDRGYSGRRQPSTVLLTDHRVPASAFQPT